MTTGFRIPHFAGPFLAAFAVVLLLVPEPSPAQTFFGSGSSTNAAPNVTNVALGFRTLYNNSGTQNIAIGWDALYANTTGNQNTAIGQEALEYNTTGYSNTAIGVVALGYNTTGDSNTAIGSTALYFNTTGTLNTAIGSTALYSNTTGNQNTAIGWEALYSNTTGNYNTASGDNALVLNTTGTYNTAAGVNALYFNSTGYASTATGLNALFFNTTGSNNTADGVGALQSNTTGNNNIALGYTAGVNLTTGSNNIDIGNTGVAAESGGIRIGTQGTQTSTYIAGISGVTASSGVAVYINANGQLGTIKSSRRFKKDIHDMSSVSDRLMQLRPVTFRYKEAAEDGTHPLEYGLIAEEVAKVYPNLVQYDKAGKPFTIYYHLLTPMLLNELQKAHHQLDAQKAELTAIKVAQTTEISALKSELAALKQSQQQQLTALAKLTALVQASQNKAEPQRAVYSQH